MNSIEVLLDAASTVDHLDSWKSIVVREDILQPRWMPAVSVLNENEIVVLGGTGIVDDDVSDLGDAILLDVSTPEAPNVQKVVPNYAGLLQFACENNTCGLVVKDTVIALV